MKTVRRVTAFLICAVLLSCSFVYAADYSSYTAISTKEGLNAIRNNLDGSYYLTQDIIFSQEDFQPGGAFYNEGSGWLPIGQSSSTAFTGILDGNGHKISGLKFDIVSTGTVYGGLLGYNQGTVKNLFVTDADFSVSGASYAYLGVIAGASSKGSIYGCFSSGKVKSVDGTRSATVGGIAGGVYSGSISGCSSDTDVTVTGSGVNGGGIVGSSYVDISKCENFGTVSVSGKSDAFVGGIAAKCSKNITYCYNIGSVYAESKCDSYAGGMLGSGSGTVSGCYNSGMCMASANTHEYCGGIAGSSTGTVTDCCYLTDTAESVLGKGSATATVISLDRCNDTSSFIGLDFDSVWMMDDGAVRLQGMEETFGKDVRVISFTDNADKLYAVRYLLSGEVPDEGSLPELPGRTGYLTIGWSGEINIEIDGNITIAPIYEKDAAFTYKVTASNGTVACPDGQDVLYFEDRVTLTASADGFSYWTNDGTVVSDLPKYSFLTMGNAELVAVYGQPAPAPQVYLESDAIVTVTNESNFKFSMAGSCFVPEDYTFKEAGVLLAAGDRSADIDDFVIGSTAFTVVKRKVNAAYANSQFMITVVNVFKGNYRSGRAYLILTDSDGVEHTYYSNRISVASYN